MLRVTLDEEGFQYTQWLYCRLIQFEHRFQVSHNQFAWRYCTQTWGPISGTSTAFIQKLDTSINGELEKWICIMVLFWISTWRATTASGLFLPMPWPTSRICVPRQNTRPSLLQVAECVNGTFSDFRESPVRISNSKDLAQFSFYPSWFSSPEAQVGCQPSSGMRSI